MAIVAAKQEQIDYLQDQLAYLRASLNKAKDDSTQQLTRVIEAFKPVPPPETKSRRRTEPDLPEREPETLDLSMVDPTDNDALALIARREIPPGTRMTASGFMRKIENLREAVIEAHQAKTETLKTPAMVPASVTEKIAAAEEVGKQLAGVGA
jgi:hypothetical protein